MSVNTKGREFDESQDRDPLHVPDGPITRARAKKIKVAMQGFIQASVAEFSKDSSNFSLSKMGLKEVGAYPVYLLQARNEEELQVGPYHNGPDCGAHWSETSWAGFGPNYGLEIHALMAAKDSRIIPSIMPIMPIKSHDYHGKILGIHFLLWHATLLEVLTKLLGS